MAQDLCEICTRKDEICDEIFVNAEDRFVVTKHENGIIIECDSFQIKITLEQVLQDLHDSEINVSIIWHDSELELLNDDDTEIIQSATEIAPMLIKKVFEWYPESPFASKYKHVGMIP
jgi:hypothetical protein